MSNKQKTIIYNKFKPELIEPQKLEKNSRSKGQQMGYIRYGNSDSTPQIQMPLITLDTYGIPSGEGKGKDYYRNDQQRTFIKVPLDCKDKKVKVFHDKLVELDKRLSSKDMRKKLGLKDSYKYQPIVRMPREPDSDDDEGDDKPKRDPALQLPYMKLKLNCFFNKEGEYDGVKTKLFKLKDKGDKSKDDDGELDGRELAQFQKYVCWKSSFKAMVIPNKLWAGTVGTGSKQYGLSFKAKSIKVKSPQSLASDPKESDFLDSSDEESDAGEKVETKSPSKKDKVKNDIDNVGSDSDSDSDKESDKDDSDSNSDSEDEKPKKKSGKKGKKSASSSN